MTRAVVTETQGSFTSTPPSVIHTTKDGRKYKWLTTVEQGTACATIGSPVGPDGFCRPRAPFYFYESMEEATAHYLDAIEKGPFGAKGAKEILWKEGEAGKKGGIVAFGQALKRGGYATDLNYVPKLCESYNSVVAKVRVVLQQAIETKKECKKNNEDKIKEIEGEDGNGGKLAEAKRALQEIIRKREEDKSYQRVSAVSQEEADAARKVRSLEGELAERKNELKFVDEALKKLEKNLKDLPEKDIVCPPKVDTSKK